MVGKIASTPTGRPINEFNDEDAVFPYSPDWSLLYSQEDIDMDGKCFFLVFRFSISVLIISSITENMNVIIFKIFGLFSFHLIDV